MICSFMLKLSCGNIQVIFQVQESQAKGKEYQQASESLEQMLTELQMARDNAKGMVEETYQSYKAMLDKKRVSHLP